MCNFIAQLLGPKIPEILSPCDLCEACLKGSPLTMGGKRVYVYEARKITDPPVMHFTLSNGVELYIKERENKQCT